MKIIGSSGNPEHAVVSILEFEPGQYVECVESIQPPLPRSEKWVLMVSTLFGCPIGCAMCDAGGFYRGKLSTAQILEQIDYMVFQHYPDGWIPCRQFKIQFARMGEPVLNPAVLDVMETLPSRYHAPGLMPSLSTVAPSAGRRFLERLAEIKRRLFPNGRFQLQFSIHTTDPDYRRLMIPKAGLMTFGEISDFGDRFFQHGDRKITLNFAAASTAPIDPAVLLDHFSPDRFLIKITPLNPTYRARESGLVSRIDPAATSPGEPDLLNRLRKSGYEVILSIGNAEENLIGSNCGQYLRSHLSADRPMDDAYVYDFISDYHGAGVGEHEVRPREIRPNEVRPCEVRPNEVRPNIRPSRITMPPA